MLFNRRAGGHACMYGSLSGYILCWSERVAWHDLRGRIGSLMISSLQREGYNPHHSKISFSVHWVGF